MESYYQSEYEKLLKEYSEYKIEGERNKDKIEEIQKEIQEEIERNKDLKTELEQLKQKTDKESEVKNEAVVLDDYYHNEYDKLLKEFAEYKQTAQRNNDKLEEIERKLKEQEDKNEKLNEEISSAKDNEDKLENALKLTNEVLATKTAKIDKLKNELNEQILINKNKENDNNEKSINGHNENDEKYSKLKQEYDELMEKQKETESSNDRANKLESIYQSEYEKLLHEFSEYKQQHEEKNENIEKLREERDSLQQKLDKAKQKIRNLQSSSNGNHKSDVSSSTFNNTLSTEYLEKELEQLKLKQKTKQKKQRISGILNKFAATDITSATVILKEILKQWDSKFISTNSRLEYLKNFVEILKVFANTMDINKKNEELDPMIKQVLNIMQTCRDSKEESLRNIAGELCQDDIILQFMVRPN